MRERLVSLDVFRGITIAGMLLVNNPGTWSAIYPPLEHAPWNGWTPTDLVFPFFLFIVGITTHLSLQARRARGADDAELLKQILRRGATIYLLGFLLALFPGYQWGDIPGVAHPGFVDRIVVRWEHVRIMGVLERIGIVYIIAALLTLRTTLKQQLVIVAVLLYGYWIAVTLTPLPTGMPAAATLGDPANTLEGFVDRAILTPAHIYSGSKTYDPEGILSTIPAVGTAMLGNFAGRWIANPRPLIDRIAGLFAIGSLGMVLGLMWNWVLPINKNLWTSSYVVFTAGMACVGIAVCMWLIDYLNMRRWTKPFVIYGMNPIVAFVGSGILARMIYTLWKVNYDRKPTPVQAAIYKAVYASWLPPRVASLLFAITVVVFWYGVLGYMYRRKIFLKV
jgi:predicted acyltransferase